MTRRYLETMLIKLTMKTIFLGFLFLVCSAAALADDQRNMGFDLQKFERMDEMARRYVLNDQLPGVMYGVVRREGVVHTGSVGGYQLENTFRIFSMTKPITTVAVLILAEEGKLLLTDPVARYLPEFKDPQVMREDGSLRSASRPMTIYHLLTQTSGLSYSGYLDKVSDLYAAAGIWEVDSLEAFSKKVAELPLVADPGEFWRYSESLDIAGRLIEVVSGQSPDEFYRDRLFEPLKMMDTGFTATESQLERLVPLYEFRENGMAEVDEAENEFYRNPDFASGGGGLISTLPDYMRFARMLLGNGALDGVRVLSRKSVELMMADHLLAMGAALKVDNPGWIARKTETVRATSSALVTDSAAR